MPSDIPLSIVLATTHPWPAAEECLNILRPQAERLGAEPLLGDSTGEGLREELPWVRWIKVPGASVFDLRAKATELARGQIVARTEDHCRPAADWCERIMEAHRSSPDAFAIGGAVRNGSTTRLMDWANFLTTFGPFVPPIDVAKIARVPPAANISFKRRALPARGGVRSGGIELVVERQLWRRRQIELDSHIVVTHIQSNGLMGTPKANFHNGRSTTGLIVDRMSAAPAAGETADLLCHARRDSHQARELSHRMASAGRSPQYLE